MKIIPFYLPQFHQIPENDEWWGKGFTEWTNMKKATKLFDSHYQPRVPLNNNYYDLSDVEVLRWQCKIAKEHGIYGFCFYHYWFNGHKLLEKPMELLLNNPDIDIKFSVCWANENWNNGWVSADNKILIGHDFNDENDWVDHFEYLLKFFKDPRYIIEDNKPILTIYVPHHISKLQAMLELWNSLAIDNGFDGLKFIHQHVNSYLDKTMDKSLFNYGIQFQPQYINMINESHFRQLMNIWIPKLTSIVQKNFGLHLKRNRKNQKVTIKSYDDAWEKILSLKPSKKGDLPCAFVDWDNTPRKGHRGSCYVGSTPDKFENYLSKLIIKARDEYNTDKIFLFAWNEWAEGGYLEPDEKYKYGYLKAVKNALEKNDAIS
ncbi:glycosyltransferase WbsX family protein [Photobacterium indicum]|uniref:glycosyltransferase WbsX family protein n=1 Tax=Photobacterium indicum TaxID=81447 RepID=UPI003D13746B